MSWTRLVSLLFVLALTGCASLPTPPEDCPVGTQALPGCPPAGAVDLPELNAWYDLRTWKAPSRQDEDLLQVGIDAEIPIQRALAKLLGSNMQDALFSLALKIHLIQRAQHSIDAVYYIFKGDLAGLAILGALCEAVERGVDVRLMVDALGSSSLDNNLLRAVYSCQWNAGFVSNPEGMLSTRPARVQVILFNPVTNFSGNPNRRSHDKLLVVDGFVPEKAAVVTGGRNISLDYYGLNADGTRNHDTYLDAELFLRPVPGEQPEYTVAEVAEIYFGLLAGFKGNRHLQTRVAISGPEGFAHTRGRLKRALRELEDLPAMREAMAAMTEFENEALEEVEVLLAHEFDNLFNKRVVSRVLQNKESNPNSITGLLTQVNTDDDKRLIVVSPYLFTARYYGPSGEVLLDEAAELRKWLDEDPERQLDIITNSVLTSDNFFAQAIVDLDMAPRLLLDQQQKERWREIAGTEESDSDLVGSESWIELMRDPRLRIFEVGRADDRRLGGEEQYGKLHAKYLLSDEVGFIGTANFDYRSRLYNNEMGFFFRGEGLRNALIRDFERLRDRSYRWGSPEWLEMRRMLMEQSGMKSLTTRKQRGLYQLLKRTGLYWLF